MSLGPPAFNPAAPGRPRRPVTCRPGGARTRAAELGWGEKTGYRPRAAARRSPTRTVGAGAGAAGIGAGNLAVAGTSLYVTEHVPRAGLVRVSHTAPPRRWAHKPR